MSINFPEKPAYTIVAGDAIASDFTVVGEEYGLVQGIDGLVIGDREATTDEDGNTVTEVTVTETDSEGNTVTTTVTTVTDSENKVTEITTDVDGVRVTTDFSNEGARTQISGEDIDSQVSIAVDNMSSYEGEKTVVIGSTGTVSVSAESVKALAEAGASIEFVSGGFAVEMDGTTAGTVTENVEFSVTEEPLDVTDAQRDAIGNAYSFDISLGATFQGNVIVSIPYEVPDDMDPETAKVLHVADDGTTAEMNTYYLNGVLTFETTHFSVYMIEAEPVQTPVDPDDPSIPGSPDNPDIPVIPGGGDEEGVVVPPTVVIEDGGDDGLSTTETAIVIVLGVLTAIAAVMLIVASRRS